MFSFNYSWWNHIRSKGVRWMTPIRTNRWNLFGNRKLEISILRIYVLSYRSRHIHDASVSAGWMYAIWLNFEQSQFLAWHPAIDSREYWNELRYCATCGIRESPSSAFIIDFLHLHTIHLFTPQFLPHATELIEYQVNKIDNNKFNCKLWCVWMEASIDMKQLEKREYHKDLKF